MRIVKVGVLAPTNKGIPLGVQGENRATQVEFDTRPWFREYPSGTVSAVARRDGDPAPYPLSLDVTDGTAVWQVSDTDTAKAGEGAVELTMTSAGARVRSLTFKTLVTASLTDSPVDDDAWYGWLDKAVVKVDETVQSAQRKMDEVDLEWTTLKADVTEKVEECGKVAAQAASDAHHAKVDAQATAKALESAEGSVAKAEAAANRAVDAALAADDSAVEASRSALSAGDSAEAARLSADAAANSAGDAATSASSAADAASAASGSASAAEQSATDASNAKVDAQTAKAGAETAASNAATSASNAESSATAAAKSASDAAASVSAINVIAPKTVDVAASSEIDGSVAVGAGSVAKKENEFSIGNDTLTREITHVSEPSAPTSASTKKYTDDNYSKTLTEAKKYTDANTSNALVGTVSGKLLHVEDAWPGNPLGLTIDGACKQDGTPSPDNPVPIVVIENPVLNVIGRNLLTITEYAGAYNLPVGSDLKMFLSSQIDFDSVTGVFSLKKEIQPWTNGHLFATEPLPAGTYNVSFELWSDTGSGAYTIYVMSSDYIVDSIYNSQQSSVNDKFLVGRKCAIKNEKVTVNDNQRIGVLAIVNGTTDVTNEFYVGTPLVSVATQDTYAPYVGASIPITLPSEHPYLAALPDGTHDEIVVKDGRKVLVKRVGSVVLDGTEEWTKQTIEANGNIVFYTQKNDVYRAKSYSHVLMCDCFVIAPSSYHSSEKAFVSGYSHEEAYPGQNWLYIFDPQINRVDGIKALLAEHTPTVNYRLATTETIDLGPADPIALPEAISNVWTDAELTTNMSMTYKRDINIAFDNLVQSVVAAAAGE